MTQDKLAHLPPALAKIAASTDSLGILTLQDGGQEGSADMLIPDTQQYHHFGFLAYPSIARSTWEKVTVDTDEGPMAVGVGYDAQGNRGYIAKDLQGFPPQQAERVATHGEKEALRRYIRQERIHHPFQFMGGVIRRRLTA